MADTCLMCGDIIPEGRHICLICELTNTKELTNLIIKRVRQKEQEKGAPDNE